MKAAPLGLADVIEAAETLQLRGAALEAMAAMLGFAVPDGQAPVAPPVPEPPPAREAAGKDAIGAVTPAAEALSPSVRRLEPVRQGATGASAWIDPLSSSREDRRRAVDRERIRQATCRLEIEGRAATGFLVSRYRIVTGFNAVSRLGHGARVTVRFPAQPPSVATLQRASGGSAVLDLIGPASDLTPLTLAAGTDGRWEGYCYPSPQSDESVLVTGKVVVPRDETLSGRPLQALVFDSSATVGDATGMPVVQGGHVVGVVESVLGESLLASPADDFIRQLPGEVLHDFTPGAAGPPVFEGLFAARDALALLRLAASTPTVSDRLDVPRITADLAQARPLLALPRLRVPSLALGTRILVDVGEPMQPFWDDQQELVGRVRHLLRESAGVRYVGDVPEEGMGPDRRKSTWDAFELPRPGTPVIAVTDLGCGFPARPDSAAAWLLLAERLRQRGSRLVAFAPVRLPRVPLALRRAVDVVIWDRAARRQNLSRLARAGDA